MTSGNIISLKTTLKKLLWIVSFVIVTQLFPNGKVREDGSEVNGLLEDAEQDLINNSFVKKIRFVTSYSDNLQYQNHFIIETMRGQVVYGRICTAMEGSGYAKYAVIKKICKFTDDIEYCFRALNMFSEKNPKYNEHYHSILFDTTSKDF